MDLDAALAMSLHEIIAEEEHNPPTEMEEDQYNKYLEELDISKIDLSILETACKQKEYNSIAPWQIDRLEEILTMAQQQKGLGIQGGSQWDGKKLLKETKKRGRKTDLQKTICGFQSMARPPDAPEASTDVELHLAHILLLILSITALLLFVS